MPGLLRRRLDRAGRMALWTAWPCTEGLDSVQLVFGSRHGSLNRTVELLTALTNRNTLSPTLFSLSVHNHVTGLLSIARRDRSAATAMAAGVDTLGLCLLEGANMIAEGAARVLVTYADDRVPMLYRPLIGESATHPFAVSLLLTPAPGVSRRCRLRRVTGCQPVSPPEVALMRFLLDPDFRDTVLGVNQIWLLERVGGR